jgi:hypothetical protein
VTTPTPPPVTTPTPPPVTPPTPPPVTTPTPPPTTPCSIGVSPPHCALNRRHSIKHSHLFS